MNTASTSKRTAPGATLPGNHRRTHGKDETIEILKGLRERYEEHHRVQITDDAIAAASNTN